MSRDKTNRFSRSRGDYHRDPADPHQLVRFVQFDLVRPEREDSGPVFRRNDIARLELLCDLSQDLDLDEPSLGVVISLIDQLHAARQQLAIMARAINALPSDLRRQIDAALKPG